MKANKPFSPREFLKHRRPERFSDTIRTEQPIVDRSLLEYHLEKLTSRGQEKNFELFARHLSQKEVCPNLLPQTGPVGGGDSKVDSETFPVADNLSFAWYIGEARGAANERWAFAFSAKEDWRSKVKSDIAKIAKTGRAYKKAFFVTNQFVPDRVRAEVEDYLTKKHGLDVRILDRSWILDKVFENRHEVLAIEDLQLQTSVRTNTRIGPRDSEREKELEKVEERILKSVQSSKFSSFFVDDCLLAAELSRELERPRTEVDGKFERASRSAEEFGSRHQKLVCAYSRAWTCYWWYEDFPNFARHYRTVEKLAEGSSNVYEFELLSNLWHILFQLVKANSLNDKEIHLKERTSSLTKGLDRLIGEEGRPSTSLQARSLRLLAHLLNSWGSSDETSDTLAKLGEVIRESKGLVGFPLQSLINVLMEIGQFLVEFPAYQELTETIVEVTSTRSGELTAARVLMNQGMQQLNADKPADAIKSLGRALARLYKHESRHDLVHALYACGVAYERVGLLWAARGTILNAASIATNDFWSYKEITRQQVACYNQLKWLELRLRRIPQTLAWHQLSNAVSYEVFGGNSPEAEEEDQSEMIFDGVLGMLFLRTSLWDLKWLTRLPDVLGKAKLFYSSIALRYALGAENSVEEDLRGNSVKPLSEFFRMWRDQPASQESPGEPEFYDQTTVTLSTKVLGCTLTVNCENDIACVLLAESILSAVESILATGPIDGMMAHEPKMSVSIRKSDFGDVPFITTFSDPLAQPYVEIRCSNFDWTVLNSDKQIVLRGKVIEVISEIVARVLFIKNVDETLTRLFRDDRVLERAIDFTMGFVPTANILGHKPRQSLSDWVNLDSREFPLTRSQRWDASLSPPETIPPPGNEDPPGAPPVSPHELFLAGQFDHSKIQTISLIRVPLWEKAKWKGTAFICMPDNSRPPLIAPIFHNEEASDEIFRLWMKDLGTKDEHERLRISILRGVKRNEPFTYRLIFSSNPESEFRGTSTELGAIVSRVLTMEPENPTNLNRFLEAFHSTGQYGLTNCMLKPGSSQPILKVENVIIKRELHVREAWQIGPNDVDIAGLLPTDDPQIPPDQKNAPVLETLRKLRE